MNRAVVMPIPSAIIDAWNGHFSFHRVAQPERIHTPHFVVDRKLGR